MFPANRFLSPAYFFPSFLSSLSACKKVQVPACRAAVLFLEFVDRVLISSLDRVAALDKFHPFSWAVPPNKRPTRELSFMPWSKSKSRGPMNMQPEHDASISPSLPLMPTLGETQKAPTTEERPATRDAVRAAKARITRLRQLQKQRDAQMPNQASGSRV